MTRTEQRFRLTWIRNNWMMTFVSSTYHFDSHTTWSLRTKFLCLPTAPRFEHVHVRCGISRFDHRGDGSLILNASRCVSFHFSPLWYADMPFCTCIYIIFCALEHGRISKLVKEVIWIFLVSSGSWGVLVFDRVFSNVVGSIADAVAPAALIAPLWADLFGGTLSARGERISEWLRVQCHVLVQYGKRRYVKIV